MEWFKRGARARTTKQKARQDRLQLLLEEEEKQKNLLSQRSEISLHTVSNFQYLGTKGINLTNISKRFNEKEIIDHFSLKVCRGDRLGFVGPNGCGKSTLLNIIAENILPDSGHVEYGETVRLGYYVQNSDDLDDNETIIDYVREGGDFVYTNGHRVSAESLLEQFLFPRPLQHNLIKKLSGGERKRLRLLRLLMQNPNCLLLDEPTNDLDIPTLVRLESWLDDFPGIVIIVSHDRYFLDRCSDRLFYFKDGQIKEFIGDYATLRQYINESSAILQSSTTQSTEKKISYTPSPKKNKPTYKQTTRFKAIEEEIALKEKRQREIQSLLEDPGSLNEDLDSLCSEFQKLKEELEELLVQWEELAELM
ncbi:ABC-F family ATP-binding cassette domain-containing protein, partial [bacterium]|nr:ABC-F family ATP-binding cassette domain-containing protein [bacterium]